MVIVTILPPVNASVETALNATKTVTRGVATRRRSVLQGNSASRVLTAISATSLGLENAWVEPASCVFLDLTMDVREIRQSVSMTRVGFVVLDARAMPIVMLQTPANV